MQQNLDQGEEDTEDACCSGFQAMNRVLKGLWHDVRKEMTLVLKQFSFQDGSEVSSPHNIR